MNLTRHVTMLEQQLVTVKAINIKLHRENAELSRENKQLKLKNANALEMLFVYRGKLQDCRKELDSNPNQLELQF